MIEWMTEGKTPASLEGMAFGYAYVLSELSLELADAAMAAASAARQKYTDRHRVPRGAVLRPGLDTPLWNELVVAVRRTFRRRGDKVRLARYLGISRQRLHLLLVAETACPDAERALQLLVWLQARRRGVFLER